jgi:hypothetical protein
MAEVVPMTLERQPGGDAGGVRRDLGAQMALAARQARWQHLSARCSPSIVGNISHGTRVFSPGLRRLGFLGDIVPLSDTAGLEARERRVAGGGEGERVNLWSLLSRQPMAGRSQSTEPPVERRLYDPEVDCTGYQVRVDNHFDRQLPWRAGRLGPW